jgi:hypothetical protein
MLALIIPLVAARAGAQLQPAAQRDSGGAAPGERIRVTLNDDSVQLGRDRRSPGPTGYVEGTLLVLRPTSLDMRTVLGDTMTFPASSIQRLERYGGDGACRSSAGGEALCIIGGILGSAALGAWAGDKVARQLSDSRSKWRWRGGVTGGLVMMTIVLPVMGRDRWVAIPNWP